MPKEIESLLKQLKSGLRRMYGRQFKGAYLFGSYARGDFDSESDVDVLVMLSDFERYGEELRRTSELVGKLSLRYDTTLSVIFAREQEWKNDTMPLLLNIRAEGIAI